MPVLCVQVSVYMLDCERFLSNWWLTNTTKQKFYKSGINPELYKISKPSKLITSPQGGNQSESSKLATENEGENIIWGNQLSNFEIFNGKKYERRN